MSRPIIDATRHPKALGALSAKVAGTHEFVVRFKKTHVTLWLSDYEAIRRALRESGFDVARGFKIGPARVSAMS